MNGRKSLQLGSACREIRGDTVRRVYFCGRSSTQAADLGVESIGNTDIDGDVHSGSWKVQVKCGNDLVTHMLSVSKQEEIVVDQSAGQVASEEQSGVIVESPGRERVPVKDHQHADPDARIVWVCVQAADSNKGSLRWRIKPSRE